MRHAKNLFSYMTLLSVLLVISHSYAAVIISGKPGTREQPFPFTVKTTVYNPITTTLFIGAHEPIINEEDKSQAISYVTGNMAAVVGITPEKVFFNNASDQINPLYGKKIDFLAILFSRENTDLFAVTADQNTQVSFIRNPLNEQARAVYQSPPLQDAAGLVTSGIVGLTALPGRQVGVTKEIGVRGEERFFAAVKPNGDSFGKPGSAIAPGVLVVKDEGDKTKGKETVNVNYYLRQILPPLPLDITSSSLKIGSDLVSIDNDAFNKPVVMESLPEFNTYFTGLFVTGGAGDNDGARAVTLNGNVAITPASAIEANSIIGGIGANTKVSIHFLKPIKTSTLLDYLIVVGGVGAPADTATSVYSLPLTQSGYLAKKDAIPVSRYEPIIDLLVGRYFPDTESAQEPGDLFSPDNLADIHKARVGGMVTLPGPITAVVAEKDAVFVAVGTDSATEMAGIFCSQMIFDNLGRQQGWTDWRRAAGTTEKVFNLAFDEVNGTFWYFPGTNADSLTLLYKMLFTVDKLSPFEQAVQNAFSAEQLKDQGVQGLFDFDKHNSAFDQAVGARISVLAATGYKKVALFQSGADEGTLFTLTSSIATTFESTNNSLAGLVTPVQQISMTGSVLDAIGPIIAADIISDDAVVNPSSWLVVGGSHGVAVLANPDGSGWPQGELQKGFVNLPQTLTWHTLGNFKQVRKIIADKNKLYILTSSNLVRITASPQTFVNPASVQGIELASVALLEDFVQNGTFSDVAVSGKFALLATSVGLWRVGNGQDISQATHENSVNWTKVVIPEGAGPVTRLFVIAPTSDSTTFATDVRGGLVYALNATVSMHTTKIARFSVQGLSESAFISNQTLQEIGDRFVKDRPSIYANIGMYRNYTVTDGAALFVMRSAYFPRQEPPFLQIVNPIIRTGVRLEIVAQGSVVSAGNAYRIGPMIKRSVDGSWMIAGNNLMIGA